MRPARSPLLPRWEHRLRMLRTTQRQGLRAGCNIRVYRVCRVRHERDGRATRKANCATTENRCGELTNIIMCNPVSLTSLLDAHTSTFRRTPRDDGIIFRLLRCTEMRDAHRSPWRFPARLVRRSPRCSFHRVPTWHPVVLIFTNHERDGALVDLGRAQTAFDSAVREHGPG